MKRKAFLLFAALAALLPVCAQQPCYRLVWQDDFAGSAIDARSWTKVPRGTADWNRHMSPADTLYNMGGGTLRLWGINNRGVCPADTARFLTGGIYTKGKRHIGHGKVEIRARFKAAQGAWPAIWMMPETGKWPDAGEIDIMERLNHDTKAYQTVHTHYTYVLKHDTEPPHFATGPIDPTGWNIYAVEILPDTLVFSINGNRTFSYPRLPEKAAEGQFPFGTPYYLLVDMQIEGDWVGPARPDELPACMEVDWVKMYELVE